MQEHPSSSRNGWHTQG